MKSLIEEYGGGLIMIAFGISVVSVFKLLLTLI